MSFIATGSNRSLSNCRSLAAFLLVASAALASSFSAGCGGSANDATDSSDESDLSAASIAPLVDSSMQLLITPSAAGHEPFIDAIQNAGHSVRLVMFHLTDAAVISALVDAQGRGVNVQVILDQSSLEKAGYYAGYTTLKNAHVGVVKSSAAFSITHEKSMVVDGNVAFITAMNMTNDQATTRDFGIVTHDASVIKEWISVFTADLNNAAEDDDVTPKLSVTSLVWSPVDSENKLVTLIGTAKSTIDATVESLNDAAIISALESAVKRGVAVRVIVPMCDQNPNPLLNYPALSTLSGKGVSTRVMPYPATASEPYMHSKMIQVDHGVAYVGSINFSTNSTGSAREAGLIFKNTAAAATIHTTFNSDWNAAVAVPKTLPTNCPVVD